MCIHFYWTFCPCNKIFSYLHFHNNRFYYETFVSVSEASDVTPPCTPAVTRNPLGGGGSGGGDRLTVDEPKQNSRRISKDKENRKESRTHLYMWVGVLWELYSPWGCLMSKYLCPASPTKTLRFAPDHLCAYLLTQLWSLGWLVCLLAVTYTQLPWS